VGSSSQPTGTIEVAARFNGPRGSGNGGYACGLVAGKLGGRAEVSLRKPVPLDVSLAVVGEPGSVQVLEGEEVVCEGRATGPLDLDVPVAVGLEQARRAAASYRGTADERFSRCFVCGLEREDSLGIFAGEVEGGGLVATPWTPPAWTAGPDGRVLPEFVWAVLDCPTYFATYVAEEQALSFLVRQSVEVHAAPVAGEEHVVIAWPLGVEGRKRNAGAAVLSAEGDVLATCRAMLVEPRG
jgi:hypothetical protein